MLPLSSVSDPLGSLSLGDIVVLPPSQSLSVRVVASLPGNELGLARFAIVGEMEFLLASKSSDAESLLVLQPVDYLPPQASSSRVVAEGAAAYWAPNLPALAGGMGEVYYRVIVLRGQVTPMVLVYRGPELIVFVHAGNEQSADLRVYRMPRAESESGMVPRVAAVVDPLNVPLPTRAPVPAQMPVPTRR